jgi:hypothetical protein
MHRRAATWAVRVFRLDRHIDMWQMGGERAPVGATLVGARPGSRGILLVFTGFICRNDLFDILKRQPQLLGIELLRTSAKLRTLQLAQKMAQPIILRKISSKRCQSALFLASRETSKPMTMRHAPSLSAEIAGGFTSCSASRFIPGRSSEH